MSPKHCIYMHSHAPASPRACVLVLQADLSSYMFTDSVTLVYFAFAGVGTVWSC